MSALGQNRSFSSDQPDVRYAPKADIHKGELGVSRKKGRPVLGGSAEPFPNRVRSSQHDPEPAYQNASRRLAPLVLFLLVCGFPTALSEVRPTSALRQKRTFSSAHVRQIYFSRRSYRKVPTRLISPALSLGCCTPSMTGTSAKSNGLTPARHATLIPYWFGFERRW